jgi:hypothetical protein
MVRSKSNAARPKLSAKVRETRDPEGLKGLLRLAFSLTILLFATYLCVTSKAQDKSLEFIGQGNSRVSWGVLRAWQSDHEGRTVGKIGDRISVQFKNFDGWIIEQIASKNYPQSLKPSEQLDKLIEAGLYDDAIRAKNEAEKLSLKWPGAIKDWFDPNAIQKTEDGEKRSQIQEFQQRKHKDLLGFILETSRANPYQIVDDAFRYMQKVFDFQVANLRLRVNDIELVGTAPLNARLVADEADGDDSKHTVAFELDPSADQESWQKIRTKIFPWGFVTLTLMTTLTDREHTFPTAVVAPDHPQARRLFDRQSFTLLTADPKTFYGALCVVLILLTVFIIIACSTDVLRDPGRGRRVDGNLPFSLSRVQMAFWLFVVIASFLFLFVATQKVTVLNTTCLWLIGIGSGTALAAAGISGDKPSNARSGKKVFPFGLSGFGRGIRNFLNDMVTDETEGYAIYRFQMLAWTIVLGFVFIFKVASDRQIPDFDVSTLGLLGISSGTYLGFKITNQKSSK